MIVQAISDHQKLPVFVEQKCEVHVIGQRSAIFRQSMDFVLPALLAEIAPAIAQMAVDGRDQRIGEMGDPVWRIGIQRRFQLCSLRAQHLKRLGIQARCPGKAAFQVLDPIHDRLPIAFIGEECAVFQDSRQHIL